MEHSKWIKKVANPVNEEENFADKWVDYPQRQKNFENWLKDVQTDLDNILNQKGKGLPFISESMVKPFGEQSVARAFSKYGEKYLKQRESGAMKMAARTGMLGSTGRANVPQHKPFGKNE
jgi:hypothetical protein